MKAINKHENYVTFNISEIGIEGLKSLITEALRQSSILSVSEELPYYDVSMYKTQIPYNSGFIQDRFVYQNSTSAIGFIFYGMGQPDPFGSFFCVYTCWDFYTKHNLLLSINIVQDIVTVDSTCIDLSEYNYIEGEPANE